MKSVIWLKHEDGKPVAMEIIRTDAEGLVFEFDRPARMHNKSAVPVDRGWLSWAAFNKLMHGSFVAPEPKS